MPEIEGIGTPAQRRGGLSRVPPARRRLVAVAVSPMELVRPESDLARLVGVAGRVDLLIARADAPATPVIPAPLSSPVSAPIPVAVPAPLDVAGARVRLSRAESRYDSTPAWDAEAGWDDLDGIDLDDLDELDGDDLDGDDLDGDDDYDEADGIQAAVEALGLHDVHVHRLGLPGRIGPGAEDDLVAALSELVGFDPEPGVYCVAPVPSPTDSERTTVVAAVQRVARVYGLPLLRYRCLELSVVGGDD